MKKVFALCCLSLLLIAACRKEQPLSIEGVWRGVEQPYWVLTISDGHYVQKLPADGYVLEYAYRINGNTVALENLSTGIDREQVWDISGDTCTVFEVGHYYPNSKYVRISE